MNKYISIQDAEFENNPIYVLCAPRRSGKTVALLNYIANNRIPCDYLYIHRPILDNVLQYIQSEINNGVITNMPMLHFVEFQRSRCFFSFKNFSRLIIEIDEIDLYDLKSILHTALNTFKYRQVILVGTPDKFKQVLLC